MEFLLGEIPMLYDLGPDFILFLVSAKLRIVERDHEKSPGQERWDKHVNK